MAIVKFVTARCPMNNIFPYVMNSEKTDGGVLVSGIHCMPETALDEFRFVKNKFGKTDGRQYYHIVQSFSPDDNLDAETAHEIGMKFAEFFPGYQIVVATHCNCSHLHNHIIMNSVNMENGKKFHQTASELARVKSRQPGRLNAFRVCLPPNFSVKNNREMPSGFLLLKSSVLTTVYY